MQVMLKSPDLPFVPSSLLEESRFCLGGKNRMIEKQSWQLYKLICSLEIACG
jgi:hypothetical protein